MNNSNKPELLDLSSSFSDLGFSTVNDFCIIHYRTSVPVIQHNLIIEPDNFNIGIYLF